MHSCSCAHLAVRHGGERLCPAPARLTDSSQVKIVHFQALSLAQYEAMSVKATCHHINIERALTSVSCRCKVTFLPRHGRWKVHRCELVRDSKHRCSLGLRSCSSALGSDASSSHRTVPNRAIRQLCFPGRHAGGFSSNCRNPARTWPEVLCPCSFIRLG